MLRFLGGVLVVLGTAVWTAFLILAGFGVVKGFWLLTGWRSDPPRPGLPSWLPIPVSLGQLAVEMGLLFVTSGGLHLGMILVDHRLFWSRERRRRH